MNNEGTILKPSFLGWILAVLIESDVPGMAVSVTLVTSPLGSVVSHTISDMISEDISILVPVMWLVYISLLLVTDLTFVATAVLNSVVGMVTVLFITFVTVVFTVVWVIVVLITELGWLAPWLYDFNALLKAEDSPFV